jgi:DNA-binding NarL/FixJ family response regulator
MNRIILADNQAIFRAGAARVLALEDDMRIVAQCEDAPASRMPSTPIETHPALLLQHATRRRRPDRPRPGAGTRVIMVAENGAEVPTTSPAAWTASSSAMFPAPT